MIIKEGNAGGLLLDNAKGERAEDRRVGIGGVARRLGFFGRQNRDASANVIAPNENKRDEKESGQKQKQKLLIRQCSRLSCHVVQSLSSCARR